MQVTLHIVTVKPETVEWWGTNHLEEQTKINEAIRLFPGVIKYERKVIDTNTVENTIVFNSVESYLDYRDLWRTSPLWAQRKAYNEENMIVTFTTESYD